MSQTTYLYVLHFDTPLSHATHYTGITTNVPQRMQQHATNHGARIVAAVANANITWHLAAVYEIGPDATARDTEKLAKAVKKASTHCPTCGPATYPKNCRPTPFTPFTTKETKCPNTNTKTPEHYASTETEPTNYQISPPK